MLDIENAAAYDAMAPFYARYWGTRFFGKAKQLFRELLLRYVEPGAAVLDLCCGTGDFAEWLDGNGMIVTGVDNSACMLACASAKVPYAQFYRADMRTFQLPLQFDFATCFYNSINQALTLADLRKVLLSVRRHLRPGGRFLFDAVEESGYAGSWEADEVVQLDDTRCEIQYRYDKIRGIASCRVVIGESMSGLRKEFIIRQRPFALHVLRAELRFAGFALESVTSVREAVPLSGRLAILARAPGPEIITRPRRIAAIDTETFARIACASHSGRTRVLPGGSP